jgi:hypothetical protein
MFDVALHRGRILIASNDLRSKKTCVYVEIKQINEKVEFRL